MRHPLVYSRAALLALMTITLFPTVGRSDSDAPACAGSPKARWTLSYSSTDPEMYHGMSFSDATHGWIVGDSGKILHTGDAGHTWKPLATSSTHRLICVQFLSTRRGWAAGESNTVLRTDNGGRSWVADPQPVGAARRTFTALQFTDELDGWMAHNYGGLLHTRDGGRTWEARDGLTRDALVSMCFLDAKTGWALSVGGTLLQTVDGGQSWSSKQLSAFPHAVASFTTISFSNASHGWIGTDTGISSRSGDVPPLFRTTDSGRAWFVQGHWPGTAVRALGFQNAQLGWCAEMSGIYSTQDGGATWVKEVDSSGDPFVQMVFVGASHGWALTFTGDVYTYVGQDR